MHIDETARMNRIVSFGKNKRFPEHGDALLLEKQLGSIVNDYRIFTFVRDPYDKIVSAYFFY